MHRYLFILVAGLLGTPGAEASISIETWRANGAVRYSLDTRHETLRVLASELQRRTGLSIRVKGNPHQRVSLRVHDSSAAELVRYIAAAAGRGYSINRSGGSIDAPAEPRVDLDVKDADVRDVFEVLRLQCGIRNLVIDPGVEGKATFLFKSVECPTALRVVLRTYALETMARSEARVGTGTRP